MENKPKQRLDFIDFAKGFAILTIVAYHALKIPGSNPHFQKAIQFGGTGVHLFIFLSGFGLTLSKYIPPLEFYKKRFSKILVPYFILVTIMYLLSFVTPFYAGTSLYAYLGHIFLYKMFDNSIVETLGSHLWFISTIIQFYFAYPFLRTLMQKIGHSMFFVSALTVSVVYWLLIYKFDLSEMRAWNSSSLNFLWEFALAMIVAEKFKNSEYKFWEQKPYILIIVAIVGVGGMGALVLAGGRTGRLFNDIPGFFGYTALTIIAYGLSKKIAPPLNGLAVKISNFSYSLYLIHLFFLDLFLHLLPLMKLNPNSFIYRGVYFIVIIVISFFYDTLVNKIEAVFRRKPEVVKGS